MRVQGYRSRVHQGPLRPMKIWLAPYQYALPNILAAMMMVSLIRWQIAVFHALVHITLIVLWRVDPHLLPIFLRSFWYRRYYGAW